MANSRKNEWTVVQFQEVLDYIKKNEIPAIRFAKDTLEVTNSTFHNWKKGKATPDTAMQEKIRKIIGPAKKTTKKKAKKTRGAKNQTLDDLKSSSPITSWTSPRTSPSSMTGAGRRCSLTLLTPSQMPNTTCPGPEFSPIPRLF